MLKRLMASVREFKRPTILTLIFIVGEAVIEVFIPFITAELVNEIKAGVDMNEIIKLGVLLVILAMVSLTCGGIAAFTCAKASSGFARNLRSDIFSKVQTFSFENIDKFSSSSLVTRMTTDISNVQFAYMMVIRTAIRSPLMFVFSITMAYIMGGALATTFVVVVPILIVGLLFVSRKAMPAFRSVFRKYDRLNESIEENVRAMRVVKGFAREDYEKNKFGSAAENIRRDFTRAERIVAWNSPLMQFCVYFNMAFVLLVGSRMIITSGGTVIDVGQISAMLTYGMADTDVAYDAVDDLRHSDNVVRVDEAYLRGARGDSEARNAERAGDRGQGRLGGFRERQLQILRKSRKIRAFEYQPAHQIGHDGRHTRRHRFE